MFTRHRLMAILNHRRTTVVALCVSLVTGALWAYSGGLYYRTLPPLAVVGRLPGALFQVMSADGALHLLALHEGWEAKPEITLEPRWGSLMYHHGALSGLGFVVAFLPKTYDGGDYTVPPHAAVVLPYWFLTGLSAAIAVRGLYVQWRDGSRQ